MMPIFFIVVGIAAIYCFYLFIQTATPAQMAKLLLVTSLAFAVGFLILLAVTGRLPTALGILLAIWPIMAAMMDDKRKKLGAAQKNYDEDGYGSRSASRPQAMTRTEALDILNLNENADADDIQEAYTRLMKQVHPDQGGSDWFAAKLNEARDFLMTEREKNDAA